MKTVGVLGGLGPETTAKFYLEVIRLGTRTVRPSVHMVSLPLNLQKEREYIALGAHREYYLTKLLAGAHALARSGSHQIVIPCNTVHEFHAQLVAKIPIPVLDMILLVAQEVASRSWNRVLVLATSRTIQTSLYQRHLTPLGITAVLPDCRDQCKLDELIQGLLGDRSSPDHQRFLESLIAQSGTEHIVLGCTDLQLLFPPSETVVDSMAVLAQHSVRLA